MAIVPITGLNKKDKQEVETILSRLLNFSSMDTTRKSQEERRYLLITTNYMKANAERKANNVLGRYYKEINL